MMGSREPAKLAGFARDQVGLQTGTNDQAVQFGELIVLATPFDGTAVKTGTANYAFKMLRS